ncbi:5-oxoprolinase (ATP-hydrolyzing) [Galdieria sulphuraria]|uniref:5-oxoprolinase (ATP-hydrolysing) n=1 Tax=Galdieria sulphuraria TaxID=130081 RepID=M2X0S4_GALSU|nr:5-oxoprolinase (ATP-hydrolyzing) [Galdieria sulphuraria]EME29950.1 5-oxoprolinase (ATP-hydrolysing) [Galdieria sulphuraria]|eukprot:XP_005706470.1 5-oxoprolinase (ATP-hydrolysing) [Galdieria sulphuraria]
MGTTIATNALLERKGENVLFITTKGLKDVLKIGNQSRPKIFDLKVQRPEVLYEDALEVDERVRRLMPNETVPEDAFILDLQEENLSDILSKYLDWVPNVLEARKGSIYVKGLSGGYFQVLTAPNLSILRSSIEEKLKNRNISSIAVALLHSYAFPLHEKLVEKVVQTLDGVEHLSLSHELMPMLKIVPRGSTSCVDAYLTPKIKKYIKGFCSGFQNQLEGVRVQFMQSDGGLCPVHHFCGFKAILSGPAGGVIGYAMTCYYSDANVIRDGNGNLQRRPVVGFDMGGTSTDVSRYNGTLEHIFETQTAGVMIQAPQLDIHTVAAGGGSRLFFRSGLFVVGPESSGAHPGPICYRKGGYLSITDANVVLGRVLPDLFPKIFGPQENESLDIQGSRQAMEKLTTEINAFRKQQDPHVADWSVEQVALGFIRVANETMCRPIRSITEARGYDVSEHTLAVFGGAGGQHACAVARSLGMKRVFVHRFSGILSAYGLGLAEDVTEAQEPCAIRLDNRNHHDQRLGEACQRLDILSERATAELASRGIPYENIKVDRYLHLRYQGTDFGLMIREPEDGDYVKAFIHEYETEHGFRILARDICVDDVRVRAYGTTSSIEKHSLEEAKDHSPGQPFMVSSCYFEQLGYTSTPVFLYSALKAKAEIEGPAMIVDPSGGVTAVIEPNCHAFITESGDLVIDVSVHKHSSENRHISMMDKEDVESQLKATIVTDRQHREEEQVDPIQLSIFSHRFMSIAEQMGRTLQRTAISTNIKERLDFSCALFDERGGLVANAPHVPVHLGSMQDAVGYQIRKLGKEWKAGDVILSNHPIAGGSHLPDITIITPVFVDGKPVFFVASRGHHADIGGLTPGSMPPFSRKLDDEGLALESFLLVHQGEFREREMVLELEKAGCRCIGDVISDLRAQVAANQKGILLLVDLCRSASLETVQSYMRYIQAAAAWSVRDMLRKLAHQALHYNQETTPQDLELDVQVASKESVVLKAVDFMDDASRIELRVIIDPNEGSATFDFTGTTAQVYGNTNAPRSVTASAVIYCLRCLVDREIPLNQGCLDPITIVIPEGSLLKPSSDAAVVGGNVLTSQRLVDVVLKAFGACAASQGCMNNFTFGNANVGYYETIAGGAGAGPGWNGSSGIHTHMTNTRITDAEVLESRYPVLLRKFLLRENSGGQGKYRGGDGVIREIEFLVPMTASILSERRVFAPWGSAGGADGLRGENYLIRKNNQVIFLGGRNSVPMNPGDAIRILTPGGGGFGLAQLK